MALPRSRSQRKADTLHRLATEADIWVASADGDRPYLVPLSLHWDGRHVVISAEARSRTIQNLLRTRATRLGLGPTRDVVIIDAVVTETWSSVEVPDALAEAYEQRVRWDPRRSGDYTYVQLTPRRIQAWREENEIAGRILMRDGTWLD